MTKAEAEAQINELTDWPWVFMPLETFNELHDKIPERAHHVELADAGWQNLVWPGSAKCLVLVLAQNWEGDDDVSGGT